MRYKGLFLAIALGILASCSKEKEIDHSVIAAKAAQHYYENLAHGKFELFLDGTNMAKKLPTSYRQQLIANLERFTEQQQKAHSGIKSVSIANAQFFAKDSTASVFLILHYGDSSSEQIVVQMLKRKDLWIMR